MKNSLPSYLVVFFCLILLGRAFGDIIHFKNGTSLEGKVLEEGDEGVKVLLVRGSQKIETTFPKEKIDYVEYKKTPQEIYAEKAGRLAAAATAKDWFELALWCKENHLEEEMKQAFEEVLEIEPEHIGARKGLGYVKFGNRWHKASDLLQRASRLLAQGDYGEALRLAQPLDGIIKDRHGRYLLYSILAECSRKLRRWKEALHYYDLLAPLPYKQDERFLVQAKLKILSEHPDGAYQPGQYLSDDFVLQQAITDAAYAIIEEGQKLTRAARELHPARRARATNLLDRAEGLFDKADLLVPGIAKSYKVEVVRQKINLHQTLADELQNSAERLKAALGVPEDRNVLFSNSRAWKAWRERAGQYLKVIAQAIAEEEKVLKLTAEYPEELKDLSTSVGAALATLKLEASRIRTQGQELTKEWRVWYEKKLEEMRKRQEEKQRGEKD